MPLYKLRKPESADWAASCAGCAAGLRVVGSNLPAALESAGWRTELAPAEDGGLEAEVFCPICAVKVEAEHALLRADLMRIIQRST